MQRKITLWLIVIITLGTDCLAQDNPHSSPVTREGALESVNAKPYVGRFRVDCSYAIDDFILYYVCCIDTIDLKWGGIFWTVENYSRIALTIVTEETPDDYGTLINIGDTLDIGLTPYYGAWSLRENHNFNKEIQYDTLYKKDGSYITIPRDSIWNQLMVSPKIRGKYFCP